MFIIFEDVSGTLRWIEPHWNCNGLRLMSRPIGDELPQHLELTWTMHLSREHPYAVQNEPADRDGPMEMMKTARPFQRHLDEIFHTVVLGITLEEDLNIQEKLRPDGAERFCVRLDGSRCWIEIGAAEPAIVHRSRPTQLREAFLADADKIETSLRDELVAASLRVKAELKATEVLSPLVSLTNMPLHQSLAAVLRWAPAIEMAAYGAATAIIALLDQDRHLLFEIYSSSVLKTLRRQYWSKLLLAARLTLISTPVEARPWLSDMAQSFAWIEWTPSFGFVRERSLWLTAIAARAAAAFGPTTIEQYFQTLESTTVPMKTLDALFGLTAIALTSLSERTALLRQLKKSVAGLDLHGAFYAPTLHLAAAQAVATIDDPVIAERRSKQALAKIGLRRTLFEPAILACDGTVSTEMHGIPALSILPAVLSAPIPHFFPLTAERWPHHHLGMTDAKLSSLVSSAWGKGTTPVSTTIH